MRIVYLHQYFNTPAMAGGTRSFEMARRLVAAGHEVNLVTTWRGPAREQRWFTTTEAGITVHWLPVPYDNRMNFARRMWAFLRFALGAARRAASIQSDVVFATSTPLTIVLPGYYTARRQRIPLIFEVRDLWPAVPIAMGVLKNSVLIRLALRLERFAYAHATRIVALAPGMKQAIVQSGKPEEHVSVIPNGCDFDVFEETVGDPIVPPKPGLTIVYAGAMGLANGVDFIPRLAAAIREHCPAQSVNFYLIGDGRDRGRAEHEARRLHVLDESVFFLGPQPKHEVSRWFRAADATIMTYAGPEIVYRDSVSNKFFDSLAAGKAIIANFRGFSTLTAAAAGAGFILSSDAAEAAWQLCAIVDSPGALERAGRAARELGRSRFSRDQLAHDLESVLTEALNARLHR
jgi:glycosyltransferase involved in cell wall biosynthesis